jgi:uncharacterized membrane protein YhaH (DUF805 family)
MEQTGIRGYLVDAARTAGRSFDFSGRSSRSEVLTYYFGSLLIGILIGLGLVPFLEPDQERITARALDWALRIPLLALLVRRLHDQNRTGAWAWLVLLPIVYTAAADAASTFGGIDQRIAFDQVTWFFYWPSLLCMIAMLVAYLLPGTAGPNRFGPDPRGRE